MSTLFADMRKVLIVLVLFLNVMAQGRRISLGMRLRWIRLEVAQMTYKMTISIPLVFHLFLLRRLRVKHGC